MVYTSLLTFNFPVDTAAYAAIAAVMGDLSFISLLSFLHEDLLCDETVYVVPGKDLIKGSLPCGIKVSVDSGVYKGLFPEVRSVMF